MVPLALRAAAAAMSYLGEETDSAVTNCSELYFAAAIASVDTRDGSSNASIVLEKPSAAANERGRSGCLN